MSQQLQPISKSEPDTDGDASEPLTRTDVYDVLSNERRIALLELLEVESPQDLGDLAEAIAAKETAESPPPRNIRQSVYVTLHQTHLPKLDELGVVTYDSREKRVGLGKQAPAVCEEKTTETSEPADAGFEPYFVLVVGGLLASLASAGELTPFSAVPYSAFALATLGALLIGFAFQLVRTARVP